MPIPVPITDPPERLPQITLPALAERCEGFDRFWHREVPVTHIFLDEFRAVWQKHKARFLARGFNIRIFGDRTFLYQSLDGQRGSLRLRPEAEKLIAMARQPVQALMPLVIPRVELVCPPLPKVIEDKLFDYQVEPARQLHRALVNGGTEWGYFGAWDCSEMGTGKSFQTLAAAIATGKEICVICPKSVIGTYPRGSSPGSGWRGALAHFGIKPVFVMNYEALRTGNRQWIKKTGKEGRPFEWTIDPQDHLLIWDEAQKIKNASLARSLAFAAIRQEFPCLFASGTMADRPTNLGATGVPVGLHDGTSRGYATFLASHGCVKRGQEWDFDQRSGGVHLAKIHRAVFPRRGARVRISELGDRFPETQILLQGIPVEDVNAINEAFRLARNTIENLRRQGVSQVALDNMSSAAYTQAWHRCERAKAKGLVEKAKEHLDEGRSVAIFVNFTDVREEIMRSLKSPCGIYGGQNAFQRDKAIADFQNDRSRVIVCNLSAGGVGVSLHDVRGEYPRTALICPNNNAMTFGQAMGRVHRAGGKSRSIQCICYAENSLEEDIVENIRKKLSSIATLNDGDLSPEEFF